MVKQIHFDGPCPFLTCLKTEPHSHPVCPACGAVRYGNMQCDECRRMWPETEREIVDNWNKIKEVTPDATD